MEDYELLRDEYDKLVRSVVSKDEFERQKQELEQIFRPISRLWFKLETSESSVAQLKEQTVEAEKHRKALQECQVNSGNHINEVKLLQAELDRAEKDLEGKTEQTDEPNRDEECSRQQMKLRTNLQSKRTLEKRTLDFQVQFEEQKERCDELERAHNVTIASLEEQVKLAATTQTILDEERELCGKKCPTCPEVSACPEVATATVDETLAEVEEELRPRKLIRTKLSSMCPKKRSQVSSKRKSPSEK